MQSIGMLQVATILFAVAAAGGVVMAYIRLIGHRNPPVALSMLHGFLAAAGLTLLIYAALTTRLPGLALAALALLVLAAAGGAVMNLGYHWKQRPLPAGLLIVHAVLAVIALIMLLFAAFG